MLLAALLLITLAGCGGSKTRPQVARSTAVPAPPYPQAVPANYHVLHAWRARLTGSTVPDAIVTSVSSVAGPAGFRSEDLQVLSWDPGAEQWGLDFDAQRVASNTFYVSTDTSNTRPGLLTATGRTDATPLLDPDAQVTIGPVRFEHLLPGGGEQLVFSEVSNYGGSGAPAELIVVDFHGGLANVIYEWSGDGGVNYRVVGNQIVAHAAYWTSSDAHCCPVRTYRFVVGRTSGRYLSELSDQRPWLGVYAKSLDSGKSSSPVKVLGVVPGSPAAAVIRPGDILVAVRNAPKLHNPSGNLLGPILYDQVSALDAGQTVQLLVSRNGVRIELSIKLGSLAGGSAANAVPPRSFRVTTL
jgi:hypothetical protein